ncbi:MAG: chemotaxis protein CheW [Bdellovibrionales bacterium]
MSSGTYGSFLLCNHELALSVQHVREVVNAPEAYQAIPLAPEFLLGLLNLRGTLVPVLDLHILLNVEPPSTAKSQKVAIVENEGRYLGLRFDQTQELLRIRDEEQNPFGENVHKIIKGVFKLKNGERLVQELDVGAIFNLPQLPLPKGGRKVSWQGHKCSQPRTKASVCFLDRGIGSLCPSDRIYSGNHQATKN